MKYKSFKCNLLFYLSCLCPCRDFKMLCKEYLKICDHTPEMAKEAWRCMIANYKFRKKHRNEFKIISLGWNCMPRTLLTLWMLKPSKGAGEKSMPFDLIASPPKAAGHFLETDFADYFDGNFVYKTENGYTCYYNEAWEGVFFPHDPLYGPSQEDLEALKMRLKERIGNFRQAMAFEGPLLFVFHKATLWDLRPIDHRTEDIEYLCQQVRRIRGNKPFRILIFSCDHNDDCKKIEGADLIRLPYPHAEYIWHKEERFTAEGIHFEIRLLDTCRNALQDLLSKYTGPSK